MRHEAPEELTDGIITLRKTVAANAQAVFEAIIESNDLLYPRMRWATAIPHFNNTLEYCHAAEKEWAEGKCLNYTIWSPTNDCLGRCSLHHIDWGVPKFEIGYWTRLSVQGQGVATTATRLMTQMAFQTLAAKRVSLWCATDNPSSRRVAEKLGFIHEGTFKIDEVDALGRPVDMDIFALSNLEILTV